MNADVTFKADSARDAQVSVTVTEAPHSTTIIVSGACVTPRLSELDRFLGKIEPEADLIVLDLKGVRALDSGGAWCLASYCSRLTMVGKEVRRIGVSQANSSLLETATGALCDEAPGSTRTYGWVDRVAAVGRQTCQTGKDTFDIIAFWGIALQHCASTLFHPSRLRMAAFFTQMQQTGLSAVPIVLLMGFLIGVVLAFQGAAQLRQFGAEVFVVDLIAVSILRELGILLTSIIVAGRSGSAFTAAIGSMKVREELDAMRTMGLDPIDVMVLPRVFALLVMLPILGLVANFAGLLGGLLMSWIELGISPATFLVRLQENTDVWHLIVGLSKAPAFAVIIAVVACWQGFQVAGSAESVGQRTTASVVQSIFLVIAVDALFSLFFAKLGI